MINSSLRSCRSARDIPAQCFALVLLLGTTAAIADPTAFTGATIMPVSESPIDNGILVIEDGKITAVGANVRVPRDAEVIDVSGMVIVPGFVDTHSHIGEPAGADRSAPIQPDARVLDSINVRDAGFRRALAGEQD